MWDKRAVKGEVPERQGEVIRSGSLQEGVSGANRRSERTREERSRGSSGVSGEKTRLEPRALTVPTRDEDRRPRKQTPRTRHASGEVWPNQVRS
ncbi:hypothetical protein NDU88_003452 [Pleurodeles waltl]|uniref:Uncharacterized protein n=1 Tax=Pleurodeles waltl TaxID=8319 RepID=A0AAV7W5D7_PLEWA|nr:hypothetical protein NDU88_003452 [Pleurodeles waltl]